MNEEVRICQNCKADFVIEPDDFAFYEKMQVPPPMFCPQCRKQRRLAWRNDMNLYSRPCDLCNNKIISIYSPDSGLTVYCVKCWWSDKWDPKDYAQDYDFSKPFFLQFKELQRRVPIIALANDNGLIGGSTNSEYNQDFARSKNCYMVFIAWKLEDCMYSYYLIAGKEVVDCLFVLEDNELVYEGFFVSKCYRSKYIYHSVACSDCAFCFDCRDCSDCFMSAGLRHKRYCFKNKQYSKEEYETILREYKLDTHSGVRRAEEEFQEMIRRTPRRFAAFRNSPNSTGDCLSNCKNARDCFFVQKGEDCRFVEGGDTPKDSYDLSVGGELSLAYEGITPDHTYMGRFGIFSWKNTDYHYLDGCHSSEHVFGCAGLKKAQYCILNKQYTKEEYAALLPKIKQHMNDMPYVDKRGISHAFGEFFPAELSYFGYNESVAQDDFPYARETAVAQGLNWRENMPFTKGKETMRADELPESIRDAEESILNEILACAECGRNYRMISQEFRFYKRMDIPIPRRCFFCRHASRLQLRNPSRLFRRTCQCAGEKSDNGAYANASKAHASHAGNEHCHNQFDTSYAPEKPEIVYCEQCYNAEIV